MTEMTSQNVEWLNTKSAAAMLGITPRTLYKLVDQGQVSGQAPALEGCARLDGTGVG